ncbi:hypothetical protein D3C71_2233310 [compost metagenome]
MGITRFGIRYSNIEPLQDISAVSFSMVVNSRPSAYQLFCGSWLVAMARKLVRRISEGRRS